jgi:hypothetical protein
VPNKDVVLIDSSTVTGTNNYGCDGVYDYSFKQCHKVLKSVPAPTFDLGNLASVSHGVQFSQGLTARIIARFGEPVNLWGTEAANTTSSRPFHKNPDGAAVYELEDGAFVYVSNSEEPKKKGGVFALEFDKEGHPRNYYPLLLNTTRNCNGGPTPWNTWVSCEEVEGGQCWQVDPLRNRIASQTVLGGTEGGLFEAFACDDRNLSSPAFFVTEDAINGALRRFRPNPTEPLGWSMLHTKGTLDYLEFLPNNRFHWTHSLSAGRNSSLNYYPNCEAIIHWEGILMFVSKKKKKLFQLDLDRGTYRVESTKTQDLDGGGSFGAGPDHLLKTSDGLLYFTEDGGSTPGVFAHDGTNYHAMLEAEAGKYDGDEVTGIAFSPDRKHFFANFQEIGFLFQVCGVLRGLSFSSKGGGLICFAPFTLDI